MKKIYNPLKLISIFLIIATTFGIILSIDFWKKQSPSFIWTMVNVNSTELQGDAHLIEMKNGKTLLIDAGYLEPAKQQLVPVLQEKQIEILDLVFITHPHRDHYEGLIPILDAGIKIKEVYFNIPDKSICDREIPWGCDYEQVLEYHQILKDHQSTIKFAQVGQSFNLDKDVTLKIIYGFDGINTPVGKTDINDMSLIMMIESRNHKYLFTGDLNQPIGNYLATNASNMMADVLKVPHHGTEALAPNEFFSKVQPKYALVPSPANLWCSDRSSRPRNWFEDHQIPVFINGFSGHILVKDYHNQIKIIEEKETDLNLCE